MSERTWQLANKFGFHARLVTYRNGDVKGYMPDQISPTIIVGRNSEGQLEVKESMSLPYDLNEAIIQLRLMQDVIKEAIELDRKVK